MGYDLASTSKGVGMLPRVLVSLLIVAIQACPFCCAASRLEGMGLGRADSSCCSRCALRQQKNDSPEHQSEGLPGQSEPNPVDSEGQCVCGGALIDKTKPFELKVERPLHDVVATVPLVVTLSAQAGFSIHSPAQHVRTTPGRLLCCLYMSFLC